MKNPLVTASTFVYTKVNGDYYFLFVGRDDGTLAFPGGHIDPGEAPCEAAKRELYEETGLRLADVRLFKIETRRKPFQYHFHFWGEVSPYAMQESEANDDATFAKWIRGAESIPSDRFAFSNKYHLSDFRSRVLDK